MAAMDMRRARAIAEQRIKSGRNNGLALEDLVQQIIAESAGAPDTAIGNALMVVPPRTMTPATPAPMQAGVPLVAPKPTAEMMPEQQPQRAASRPSRYQPELDRVMADIAAAQQATAGQQLNVMDQIRLATLKEQADRLGALVRAEGSPDAEIPEEMLAALGNREKRFARREELLEEARARSPWEALLAGGAAMAQGRRGERFTEALARGLQTGLQQYGSARRAGEEGAESVAESRDQAMIDRYNMQERAREAARQRALELQGISEKAEERAVRNVRLPQELRTGEAQTALAEFKAKVAPEEFATEQDVRRAQAANYREISGGGRGGVDVEGRADRAEAGKAAARYRGYAARYEALRAANPGATLQTLREADPKTVDDYLAARAELEGYSAELERTQGFTPYIGGRNPSVGALTGGRKPPVAGAKLAPDGKYYVPDPKRPGKYLQVG